MKKIILLIIYLLSLAIFSCDKETDKSLELNPDFSSKTKKLSIIQIEENVGLFHNAFLDSLEKHDSFYEFSNQQLVYITNAFLVAWEVDSLSTLEKENLLLFIENIEPTTIALRANDLNSLGIIDTIVLNHFLYLEEIVSQNVSVFQMLSDLSDFENTINNDDELNELQKHSLIGPSIIARFSLQYWNEVYNDNQRGWYSILLADLPDEGRTPIILASPRWLRDIIGYIDAFFDCYGCDLSGRDRNASYHSGVASGS